MVQQCECCGRYWGGLRVEGQETPKDCPWCGATEEAQIRAMLERAAREVAPVIAKLRECERISDGLMEMRLR